LRIRQGQVQFILSIKQWDEELAKLWSSISYLNGVISSDALRDVDKRCLPKLTEYSAEMRQKILLQEQYKFVHDSTDKEYLSAAQRKAVENSLRDFKLLSIALSPEKQLRV